MKKLMVTITVFLIIVSCSQQRNKSNIKQRINCIENSLIEFKSIDKVFQPDSSQLANPKSIDERMKHYKTPGVSIAVINNNQLEWAKAYGITDVNTGEPVTTETIFEAGSTSKLITAVMVLHFVQLGLIDLDINVNNYLKSWKVPENEFTLQEKVTLRRLLTHQAGLPDTHYDSDESVEYPTLIDVLNGKHGLNEAAIPENIPGSKWQYSNIAYNVIQLLFEDVLGKPFEQIAEEIIFKPLGMNNSTFVYPLDADKKIYEAMPHDIEGISRKTLMHLTATSHGGLTTTPTDLSKFSIELMLSYQGKSEKIISQEMTKRLFSKECEIDQEKFPIPFSEGLGVFLMGNDRDFFFTHPGNNNPGFSCWLIGWPEHGTATVIMINGKDNYGIGLICLEIISAIKNEYIMAN